VAFVHQDKYFNQNRFVFQKKLNMKKILFAFFLSPFLLLQTNAQELKTKPNWQNLDFEKDVVRGMSVERAYQELLKGRTSKTVVVAVIDGGTDVNHEDLKDKLWVNTKEIAGNGKDDDKNGFVDDINGWDFLGGKDGQDVNHEQVEITRMLKHLKDKFGTDPSKKLIRKNQAEYDLMGKLQKEYEEKRAEAEQYAPFYAQLYKNYTESEAILKNYLKVETLTKENITGIDENNVDRSVRAAKRTLEKFIELGATGNDIKEAVEHYESELKYNYNLDFNARTVVGDNPDKLQYGEYGNNEVTGPDGMHGSHVAGIIGANRNNNLGVLGVADDVKLMIVRAVPDGDERDKDVANAIRYATDNGAQIINMSFGKPYSPEKKWVDDAVKYAQSKGVLFVAAAGNDNLDVDVDVHYPTATYENGQKAENWISVGALSWKNAPDAVAEFSNYGKKGVDVFAPGVDIYSTVPGSKYEEKSGTSMAAPATTGVAALLKSYFPELTAAQIKKIILESSVKVPDFRVYKPGSKEIVKFEDLSATGGIVNAYNAVKMAKEMMKVE
jgi:subtilisin family serine protease